MCDLLTEHDKERIEEEELFRKKIQAALAKVEDASAAKNSGIWAFVNSNIALWFLSAIFITWAGNWYSQWQKISDEELVRVRAQIAEDSRKREIYERVTLEISYRYSAALAELRSIAVAHGDSTDKKTQDAIKSALNLMLKPTNVNFPPLYPEFKSYSSLALIAELRRYSNKGEADVLKGMLADTSSLLRESVSDLDKNPQTARFVASSLISVMKNEKWDNGFAYTDCESSEPFC